MAADGMQGGMSTGARGGGDRARGGTSFFTSESVTEGHPDKVCDQISDAVLDAILTEDPYARVACEAIATTGLVVVMGEITTSGFADIPGIARETIKKIGYTRAEYGFDGNTCGVVTAINRQSPDIALGVDLALEARGEGVSIDDNDETGAGDQGMMFGYACRETAELMPLPISLAHRLARRLTAVRKEGELRYLRPDGKTQVTVQYENNRPARIKTVVISAQHDPEVEHRTIEADLKQLVIKNVLPADLVDAQTSIYINPTGRFVVGGPAGDSGLTGRKIIVDTYGGMARHGGGSFSGKDPTKVDRSASYAARYVAKNIVEAGLAERAEVQLAYAIGVAKPLQVRVETFGTNTVPEALIEELVGVHFDLRPAAIIRTLTLRRPIYRPVAAYGHFGRPDLDLPWERTDKAAVLRDAVRQMQTV